VNGNFPKIKICGVNSLPFAKRAEELARIVGFGVGLALQPALSLDELRALID